MRKLLTFQPNGFWLVIHAAVLWGTIGAATQAIYNVDPTTSLFINLMRMLIATPILLIACWRIVGDQMFRIQRRDLLLMLVGGTLLSISHAAYFAAIRYSGITIATLLTICLAPLVVMGVSVLLRLETLTRQRVMALICALVGSVLLVGLHTPSNPQANLLIGTALSLISAVGYASMIVCGRLLAADYHPLQITSISFGAGTIVLGIVNLANGFVIIQTMQGLLLVMYLGLVPTALAYWLFQTGLRSVSATAASIISMLDPLVAALLAWGLFGETLAFASIIGAALLLLSIFLLATDQRA